IRSPSKRKDTPRAVAVVPKAPRVVAVGASTGGPPAVQRLLEALSGQPVCLLVSQHMPPQFTRAFADRLGRIGHFKVSEARGGDPIRAGHAYIAPGGRHLRLVPGQGGGLLEVAMAVDSDKHVPSVDRLFESVALTLGAGALAVVLTGMGADGARGAQAVRRAGGLVLAESEETAVIFGMPKEAIASGAVDRVLPLHEIGPALIEMLGGKG
ncbi:MAG: CheB methylesterase domain-containing protein, partial [Myxococcaceae bacterium]